jgi:glycosyltransferase involved in cell wall biosynthesis
LKILVLPKYYAEGSSSRYRYYNYFAWFHAENHSVTCMPLLYNGYVHDLYDNKNLLKRMLMTVTGIVGRIGYLLINKNKFDIIIIEKELVTFMPFWIEKFILRGSKFIVDYDDNINARYQTGWTRLFLSDKIVKLGKLANAITIGNHWYMELYKNIDSSKIHYLPTVVDSNLYSVTETIRQKDQPMAIVWIGSPSTVKYLKSIDDVLVKLQSQYNFTLKIIGAFIQLKCKTEFIEWSAATEITELKNAGTGIMPLENTDWEKGKCGLKLIQYMASGLPVVASYSIANKEIVQKDRGFIATTNNEWYDYLSQLLQSENLRSALGKNGKSRIAKDYSYQTWAPAFIKIIENV